MLSASPIASFPFPQVNASLNGTSALLLVAAFVCIKTRQIRAHVILVLTALTTSIAFLASYLTFHALYGNIKYPSGSPWRTAYLWLLGSHTLLAVVTLPLVAVTLLWAARRQWPRHRKLAAWTFPIWLYVSVTGVIIYWMLSAAGAYGAHP
jgi:putative membrane protein